MGYWRKHEFEPSYFRLSGLGAIFPLEDTETIRRIPGDWLTLHGSPLDLPPSYDPVRDVLWAVDIDEARFGDGTAPGYDSEVVTAVCEIADQAFDAGHEHWHTIYVVETPGTAGTPGPAGAPGTRRSFVTDVHESLARSQRESTARPPGSRLLPPLRHRSWPAGH